MKKFKLKEFDVKDVRVLAKFLVKTGLKQELYEILFPKANPNLPKNWIEMRAHVQTNYEMSDAAFKELQLSVEGDLATAIARYAGDFPNSSAEMGQKVVDLVLQIFADDMKYEETINLFAHLYTVDKALIEALTVQELVALVVEMVGNLDFFGSSQPSTPATLPEVEVQA